MHDQRSDTVTGRVGPEASPHLYVLVLEESSSAIIHLPEEGRLVIGRAPDAGVQVRDRSASRRHAELTVRGGEVELTDLGSHNGTLLNGNRVSRPMPLVSGDVVVIGDSTLVFHSGRGRARGRWRVDVGTLRRRLDEELERAALFGRPLTVVALAPEESLPDSAPLLDHVGLRLRAVDFAAWSRDGQLLLVFPEIGGDELPDLSGPIPARRGIASHPDDGFDADTLLSRAAARAARDPAAATEAADAAAEILRLELGDRTILLADPAMVRLFELVRRLGRSEMPVLITGETGVGKESAAFAVHQASRRAQGAFLPINCAALPENLIESELFGYEKGAFSGATQAKPGLLEQASGGTVFFDEVGELPLAAQAKLLRVLESKRLLRLGAVREIAIDVRIVAATNRDLEAEIEAGRFRRDLFYRLSGATLVLPPLRDRPRELSILLRAFLADACARLERSVPEWSPAALGALAGYGWPGNVRELKNTAEFLAAAVEGEVIEKAHLPERLLQRAGSAEPVKSREADPPSSLSQEIEELERTRIRQALAAAGGVKAKAARLIGMPLRTFLNKLKQLGIATD